MVDRQTQEMILEIARKYAARVAQQYQLERLYLFGSYAKGTADEDSDIDIAVVAKDFSGIRINDRLSLMKLRYDVDLRIEPHPFLPQDFKDDPFAFEIRKTGIRLI